MKNRTKKAFSLIEIIFVLVILGIVASISSQIIAQVYENYIMQRAIYNVSTKTEMAANQIVNRLAYRIQGSTISKVHEHFLLSKSSVDSGGASSITADDWLPLKDVPTGTDYTTLEWIGYDNDSFAATQAPHWSGIANYEDNVSINGFDTPGSKLEDAATIMNNLSDGKVDLTNTAPAAVMFAHKDKYYTGQNEYSPQCMGLIPELDKNTSCIFPVRRNGNVRLEFTRDNDTNNAVLLPKIITERYKLAWSAYAIVPVPIDPNNPNNNLFNLMLHYNYQPWNGESYLDNTTKKSLLLPNVTVFKFTESGGVIKFKLCASENIGEDFNVTTCKEKVVIR